MLVTRQSRIRMLASLSSTVTSPSFLVGLGVGVASTTLVSKLLFKQIAERTHVDNEDNESGGE